ncbi:MAG: hypothetical protein IMZ44_00370 [Planctomycetes bacterium]|nr:hypothetical protein [Planctomycetota bacterium]
MRKACVLLVAVGALLLGARPAPADTGTYRILQYQVKLTPMSNGQVQIQYRQKWLVTGGGIPWMTVGTPGPDFTILPGSTGAVRSARREAGGGWSGVRIDLDRNYVANETFEVDFSILQKGLLYVDKDNYRLDFTPGWYDRADIDNLAVEMFFFARVDTVTAQPAPTLKEGQRFVWQFGHLGPGQRRTVSVSFPKNLFPANVAVAARPPDTGPALGDASCLWMAVVALIIIAVIILIVGAAVRRAAGYGHGGTIFVPGSKHSRGGPHDRAGGGGGWGIFTGGGGGFGGASSSCVCACACAGCACACACAGGSAAGCDRKVKFTCPLCRECPAACPLSWGARP